MAGSMEAQLMEPKKTLIVHILDILRRYSDAEHTLSQKDILDILRREYDMDVERKAVRRNLQTLIDMGYGIEYTETIRNTPDPKTGELKENIVTSDYYLERDFTDAELRLIIDGLLFSSHIPYKQFKELVGKLEGLSNKYFKPHVKHIQTVPQDLPHNPELFYTIEVLDEAITRKRKVSFAYAEYRTDKKLHRRESTDGKVRQYIASPYQMAARDGKYYLICNLDGHDDIANYRVDRIVGIQLLEDQLARPFKELNDAYGKPLDLAKYMQEHIYMFSSSSTGVRFRIVKERISTVVDLFGTKVSFVNETDTHVDVIARVTEDAMFQFAKNYAPDVIVLEPKKLVDRLREDAEKVLEAYK
jgi:predicted DNA-binding transcriptional regulator YafY